MKLRDKLVARSQPLLPEGANVRHVFLCQTGPSPYFYFLTYLIFFWIKYRAVCVTDDAVYVLRCNKLTGTSPKELVATLPRNQQFGPVSGLWGKVELLGETHWVHKRFHKDIQAADNAMPRV